MRRLYLQIYLTAVGVLVIFGLLVGLLALAIHPQPGDRVLFAGIAAAAGERLPGPERPAAELRAELERLGAWFPVDLAVHGADGVLLAAVGDDLPAPDPERRTSSWLRSRGAGPTAALRLPDGRWLVVRHRHNAAAGTLVALVLLAVACAVGAYPLVRRLTRRLERLQERVDRLGAGDLAARVEVEGKDEVAALARSFNQATDRIERLIRAQRSVLAGASHELRSPLARMRVGIELLKGDAGAEVRERLASDIARLDELIDELLTASRLETVDELEPREELDLLALVAEEAALYDAAISGEPISIVGEARLLRRLVRNLLENARRYAAGSPVEVDVGHDEGGALLKVCDRGPGVPEAEQERIFEPFYRPPGQPESARDGTGLGLALVRRIAHRHGGEVTCRPREGGGSCFEVRLGVD